METFVIQIRVRVSDLSLLPTFPKTGEHFWVFCLCFCLFTQAAFFVPASYKKFTFTLLPAILAP